MRSGVDVSCGHLDILSKPAANRSGQPRCTRTTGRKARLIEASAGVRLRHNLDEGG
jgi:hypothetical protein